LLCAADLYTAGVVMARVMEVTKRQEGYIASELDLHFLAVQQDINFS
jgi:hypothetical protein